MAAQPERPRSFLPGSLHRRLATLTFLILAGCTPVSSSVPPPAPSEALLAPMFVADLGVDLQVEDLDAALRQMDFVETMDGFIAAQVSRESNGLPGMIVELRVPHRYAGRVTEVLSTEFGRLLSINVLSGEVSVRHARLLRQLDVLKQTLPSLSGADLRRAKDEIELLEGILTFQLRRTEFLYVEIHMTESE